LKVERRMQRYGVGSLRLRAQPNNPTEVGTGNADDGVLDRIKNAWKRIIPCVDRDKPASRSNNTRSQKRAILYMAAGYALAWAFTQIPYIIFLIVLKVHQRQSLVSSIAFKGCTTSLCICFRRLGIPRRAGILMTSHGAKLLRRHGHLEVIYKKMTTQF